MVSVVRGILQWAAVWVAFSVREALAEERKKRFALSETLHDMKRILTSSAGGGKFFICLSKVASKRLPMTVTGWSGPLNRTQLENMRRMSVMNSSAER